MIIVSKHYLNVITLFLIKIVGCNVNRDFLCSGKFPTVFCLKINHGGAFTSPPKVRYKGGKVNWIDTIDSERFSVVEVATMMEELGYENGSSGMDFFYKLPNTDLDNGLRKLETDKDVLELMTHVSKYKVIDLYVVHCVSKNLELALVENVADDRQDVLENDDNVVVDDVSEDEWLRDCLKKVGRLNKNVGQSSRNESPSVEVCSEHGSDSEHGSYSGERYNGSGSEHGYTDNGSGSDNESNSDDSGASDDSDDSDFVVDEEQMMNIVEVDMAEFKKNIDKNSEWIGCAENIEEDNEVVQEDEVDNDELYSGTDSDVECERRKALRKVARMHKVSEEKSIWKEIFFIGQQFASSKLIKEMVTRVAVEQRRQLWLKKNDKVRVRVVCKGKTPTFTSNMDPVVYSGLADGPQVKGKPNKLKAAIGSKIRSKGVAIKDSETQCPWFLQCSKLPNEETWQVKAFEDVHKCLQSRVVKKCTAKFLSKEVEATIKPNPKIPLNALKDQLQRKLEVGMSNQKVQRAKMLAKQKVIGDYTKSYSQLRDYLIELQNQNPDTTVRIDLERPPDPIKVLERKFRRVYVCLGALKEGFKKGKRDLLGLDGCFLSGPFPGQVLTAVGVDPNNGIYPLAYAIVEAETKESWKWFLDWLGDDLNLFSNSNFTFITDRQKV